MGRSKKKQSKDQPSLAIAATQTPTIAVLPTTEPPQLTSIASEKEHRYHNRLSSPLQAVSYQSGSSNYNAVSNSTSTTTVRSAALPMIHNYENEVDDPRTFFVVRGDATLLPNTGRTNRYDTALFGLALHELLEKIRLANLISTSCSIVLLLISSFWKLLMGQLARLVLASYLGFLSSLLLITEIIGIRHIKSIDLWLKHNFGLLRHPLGRCMYIVLLSTLCFAVGGWFYWAVGLLYLLTALVLFYTWTAYPELRKTFEAEDEAESSEQDACVLRDLSESVSWSIYSSSLSTFVSDATERASLLASVVRESY